MKKSLIPHDAYFKVLMSDEHVAKEFFEYHLPKNILTAADLSSLSMEKNTFVDEEFKRSEADVLYSVKLKDHPGYFYTLVEHQRKPEKLMPYRLLRYMIRIIDHHIKKHGASCDLPLIIPIVFYNGERKYPYSTDLFTLFGKEEALARKTFLNPFKLIDLSQVPDEEIIKQSEFTGVMTYMLKNAFAREIRSVIDEAAPLLKNLQKRGANRYIRETLEYILHSLPDEEKPAEITNYLNNKLTPQFGGKIMSLAERLERDGYERGLAESKSSARRIARNLLDQGLELAFVANVTGLSVDDIQSGVPA